MAFLSNQVTSESTPLIVVNENPIRTTKVMPNHTESTRGKAGYKLATDRLSYPASYRLGKEHTSHDPTTAHRPSPLFAKSLHG